MANSTLMFSGINPEGRNSSKVLRPPGGGSSLGPFTCDEPEEVSRAPVTAPAPVEKEKEQLVINEPEGWLYTLYTPQQCLSCSSGIRAVYPLYTLCAVYPLYTPDLIWWGCRAHLYTPVHPKTCILAVYPPYNPCIPPVYLAKGGVSCIPCTPPL